MNTNIKNSIRFKEGDKEYTWNYENILGEYGLIEGLRKIYNCWSCDILQVIMGYEEIDIENWIDYL